DGSFHHFPQVALSSWKFIVPLAILTGAVIYAVRKFKSKDPIAFGILYFFATVSIVSNVVTLIGTNYGERLMYAPSLVFCLIAAVLISRGLKAGTHQQDTPVDLKSFCAMYARPIVVVGVIAGLFAVKTTTRAADWKDNMTLYTTDLKNVPDSAHILL